ncbi:hypothetical protein N7467_002132 [Penicillium canescens]|nr:hypothetical protein N7467_002132 [Penicillium canescens]
MFVSFELKCHLDVDSVQARHANINSTNSSNVAVLLTLAKVNQAKDTAVTVLVTVLVTVGDQGFITLFNRVKKPAKLVVVTAVIVKTEQSFLTLAKKSAKYVVIKQGVITLYNPLRCLNNLANFLVNVVIRDISTLAKTKVERTTVAVIDRLTVAITTLTKVNDVKEVAIAVTSIGQGFLALAKTKEAQTELTGIAFLLLLIVTILVDQGLFTLDIITIFPGMRRVGTPIPGVTPSILTSSERLVMLLTET